MICLVLCLLFWFWYRLFIWISFSGLMCSMLVCGWCIGMFRWLL